MERKTTAPEITTLFRDSDLSVAMGGNRFAVTWQWGDLAGGSSAIQARLMETARAG